MHTRSSKPAPCSPAKPKPAAATPAAASTIRDATVAFGAGYGTIPTLPLPIHGRIVQYLQHNCYTPLIGNATLVPLRGTTSRALHDEIMAIGAPFTSC